jgi:hypothetical protein
MHHTVVRCAKRLLGRFCPIVSAGVASAHGGARDAPVLNPAADRLDNVNMKSLDDMSDAGAHAILWFAMDGE